MYAARALLLLLMSCCAQVMSAQFTLDGKRPFYDNVERIFLLPVPEDYYGKPYTARFVRDDSVTQVVKDGRQIHDTMPFKVVKGDTTYTFAYRCNGIIRFGGVRFTFLPVMKLTGKIKNEYVVGKAFMEVPEDTITREWNAKLKWAGASTTASWFRKHNFHVKFLDDSLEKMDVSFNGLRNDNHWRLDGGVIDFCRVRNKVSNGLWADMGTKPYYAEVQPNARSYTRGFIVELFVNERYMGFCDMAEYLDRKQMKLKKHDDANNIDHGQLWKSKDWTYAVLMGTSPDGSYQPKNYLSTPNPSSEMWDNYQVKYPDPEDYGNRTDWQTLYDAVDFVCHSSDDDFRQHIAEYLDLPVVIDYYILMETILSTDNHGKNMFFAVYDKQVEGKVTLGVWDMDATAGQRWSDAYYHQAFLGPEQDYAAFIARYEHGDYNLFKRLRDTDAEGFNLRVRQRYRDLRQTFLATESILKRFRTQLAEFKACGADRRETAKWSRDSDVSGRELNFDTELAYLENWITRRMNYLDTRRFDIASLPAGISSVITDSESGDGYVYNLEGRRIGNLSTLDLLPAGIYIVRGRVIRIR